MAVVMQKGMSPLRRAVRKIEDDIVIVPSKSSLFLDDFKDNQMRLVYVEDDSVYLVCRKGQELFFSSTFDREEVVTQSQADSSLDNKVERKYHTPSYDSGWFDIESNTKGSLEHGLGSSILRIFAYFKRSDGMIFPLNPSFVNVDFDEYTSNGTNHTGIQFVNINTKEIAYTVQDKAFLAFNHIDTDGNVSEFSDSSNGELRVLLYKTGVID